MNDPLSPFPKKETKDSDVATDYFGKGIRVVGVMIILFGLGLAYEVASRAWSLFDDSSATIVPLAEEIDAQSNINSFLGQQKLPRRAPQVVVDSSAAVDSEEGVEQAAGSSVPLKSSTTHVPVGDALSLAYFVAWILVFMLLSIIARIAFWAISHGAKLALSGDKPDKSLQKVIRELAKEMRNPVNRIS